LAKIIISSEDESTTPKVKPARTSGVVLKAGPGTRMGTGTRTGTGTKPWGSHCNYGKNGIISSFFFIILFIRNFGISEFQEVCDLDGTEM
jgi:hypothetical protein